MTKVISYNSDRYDEEEYFEEEYEDDGSEEYISGSDVKFLKEWKDIVKTSEHNAALQHALERVKIIYHLSNEQ